MANKPITYTEFISTLTTNTPKFLYPLFKKPNGKGGNIRIFDESTHLNTLAKNLTILSLPLQTLPELMKGLIETEFKYKNDESVLRANTITMKCGDIMATRSVGAMIKQLERVLRRVIDNDMFLELDEGYV